MKRKRKIKYLEPGMKFNPGTMGFEPDLHKKLLKEKADNSWFWLILLIILLIFLIFICHIINQQ